LEAGFSDADVHLQSSSIRAEESVCHQTRDALRQAAESGEERTVLICGSVFLMSDARMAMGIDEPRDVRETASVGGSRFQASQDNLPSTSL